MAKDFMSDDEASVMRDTTLTITRSSAGTRFKGLGEMNPDTLKSTTLDPRTRQPLRVMVKEGEQLLTDQVISELMGKDVAPRFKMITENAAEIGDLDV